jgi:hypothetical protein
MTKNIFGWSYPPGCSGPPDDFYDNEHCLRCGELLDEDPEENTPQWRGFCSEDCEQEYKHP